MTQKTNVFLTAKDIKDSEIIPLGHLTNTEIVGYTYALTNLHKIPSDSCVSELSITKHENHQTTLSKKADTEDPETLAYNELSLGVVPQMTKKCCFASNAGQCIRFIAGGKCKDPFVVENIGKKFFPSLYKKQH